MELRGTSISYGYYIKKKETKLKESKLLTRIKKLEEHFSNKNIEELNNLKSEINNIHRTHLKGCIMRSKCQLLYKVEKPCKYFQALKT